jgi:hypothetical protein
MSDWREKYYEDIDLHVRVSKNLTGVSVDYEVRDPMGRADNNVLLFQKPEEDGSYTPTENVEEGEVLVKGHIKWDGCSNNDFGESGYIHACSREGLTRLGTLYDRLFDWAMALMGEQSKEFLSPHPLPCDKSPKTHMVYDGETACHWCGKKIT